MAVSKKNKVVRLFAKVVKLLLSAVDAEKK